MRADSRPSSQSRLLPRSNNPRPTACYVSRPLSRSVWSLTFTYLHPTHTIYPNRAARRHLRLLSRRGKHRTTQPQSSLLRAGRQGQQGNSSISPQSCGAYVVVAASDDERKREMREEDPVDSQLTVVRRWLGVARHGTATTVRPARIQSITTEGWSSTGRSGSGPELN